MNGIVAWGTYVPRGRLGRRELASMFNTSAPGGTRSVAGPDEDALTMGLEAARLALRQAPVSDAIETCWFSTSHPPLMDRGNSASITAAIGLDDHVGSYDTGGSIRSGVATLRAAGAQRAASLAVLSDVRYGKPGSDDEANGGDAAAAFVFGDDPAVEVVAHASLSSPVMDRWRSEGDVGSSTWDDRWTAEHQVPLMIQAANDALKQAGLIDSDLAGLVVSCPSSRAEQQVVQRLGGTVAEPDPRNLIGYSGTADVGVRIIAALDRLSPGDRLLVVTGADGADALVLRATDRIGELDRSKSIEAGVAVAAPTYLLWRGLVERAGVRRPPAEPPSAPAVARNEHWKFGFIGSECQSCGTRHLPPQRVCLRCHVHDEMTEVAMRDVPATVRTFTIDRIAQSLNPPVVVGVVDFDGGGRYRCQLTDIVADEVRVGDRVEMVYRLVSIASNGVKNYFWKARPLLEEQTS